MNTVKPRFWIAGVVLVLGVCSSACSATAKTKPASGTSQRLAVASKEPITQEPMRAKVAATGPAKGPTNAPVTIVEFSDFQCPFCRQLSPTLKQIEEKYGDQVRLVFRQYPLPFHRFAQKAAEASLCAKDQGKFWQMHDAIFANQQALEVAQLKSKATDLGLNADQFNQCIDLGRHAAAIQADVKEGAAAGVTGTPAIFVNGRLIVGAVPLEQITAVIDDELRRAGSQRTSR